MDTKQFCQLDEEEKIGLILLSGKLLARHTDELTRKFLYQLHKFYVCLCYSTDDQERLQEISFYDDVQEVISTFRYFPSESDPACRIREMAEKNELRFQQEVE